MSDVDTEIKTPEYRWEPIPGDWFFPRSPDQLLESEWAMLARLIFEGGMHSEHPDERKRADKTQQQILDSLTRFGYAEHAMLYPKFGHYALRVTRGWRPSEKGVEHFNSRMRPGLGCACEHAIRLGCVCRGRTYCPNPEHFGNGCHGSHD